jgi:hypothetical protein
LFGLIAGIQSNGATAKRHLQDKLFFGGDVARYLLDETD